MSNSLYLCVNCTHGGEAFFPIFDLTTFQLRNMVKPSNRLSTEDICHNYPYDQKTKRMYKGKIIEILQQMPFIKPHLGYLMTTNNHIYRIRSIVKPYSLPGLIIFSILDLVH